MPNYVPSTDMVYDGASSADSVSYQLPGHTVSEPHFMIIDRKVPTTRSTTAEYRIRIYQGFLDAEGTRVPERSVLELTCRRPVSGVGVIDAVKGNITRLAGMLSDAALVDQMANTQILPH